MNFLSFLFGGDILRGQNFNINEVLKNYICSTAELLKASIQISDRENRTVFFTSYDDSDDKDTICRRLSEHALQTGRTQEVFEGEKHLICADCINKNTCRKNFEIHTAVFSDNEAQGVFSLRLCSWQGRKTDDEKASLRGFVESTSELLGPMVHEVIKKKHRQTAPEYEGSIPERNISLDSILSISEKVEELKERIRKLVRSTSTVLITGESGTGKEMFARAIHKTSLRGNKTFVAINCGAIPETLLESELFGYVKGAFTGADPRGRAGKFELANKGTIFLDEIGDMPLYMQVKLLRVIQDKEITRVGSNESIKIDVRIIAATNRNLDELIGEGSFREDLYYRLNVIPFEIPPLRNRKEDIELLSCYFAEKYSQLFQKNFKRYDDDVMMILNSYEWYGNVRELENATEYMINVMDDSGVIKKENLPGRIRKSEAARDNSPDDLCIRNMEERLIRKAIKRCGNDTRGKLEAARNLGIGIATLYRKLEQYDI